MKYLLVIASLNTVSLCAALPSSAQDATSDAGALMDADAGGSDATDTSSSNESSTIATDLSSSTASGPEDSSTSSTANTTSSAVASSDGEPVDASVWATEYDAGAGTSANDGAAVETTAIVDATVADAAVVLEDAGDAQATNSSGLSGSSGGATSSAPPRYKILPDDGNLSCSASTRVGDVRTGYLAIIMLVGAVWVARRLRTHVYVKGGLTTKA